MSKPAFASPRDEIVDTMINLAHLSRAHRIVVAGGDSIDLYLALRRRGFGFGVLASSCRTPSAGYSVGLIAGDQCYQAFAPGCSNRDSGSKPAPAASRVLCWRPIASKPVSISARSPT